MVRAGGVAQVVECLSKHEALSSNSSTANESNGILKTLSGGMLFEQI
jgi:hypothetical protein